MIRIFYAGEPLPSLYKRSSIFLAGPTPRDPNTPSWRQEAIRQLEEQGFDGDVYVPESPNGFVDWEKGMLSYEEQVEWEAEALELAKCIMFWVPRNMETMPGLTTNDEFGYWRARDPMKLVFGAPPDAKSVKYQLYKCRQENIPTADNLVNCVHYAIIRGFRA